MKRLVLVSAALLAFTVLSSSASAATSTITVPFPTAGLLLGGTSITTSDGGPEERMVTATPQALPLPSTNPDRFNVEMSCTATATPNALWTFVDACYLQGTGAVGGRYDVPVSGGLPGPADTAAGIKLGVPAQSYDVCMSAHGYFPGGTDGDTITTGTICL
jgi:hypothetical protein